jgi:uncharacterized protein YecE (DUF72 family)
MPTAATGLGDKRGPVLFQTPPNFSEDLAHPRAFVKMLPRAFASWVLQARLSVAGESDDEDLYHGRRRWLGYAVIG